MRTEDTTNIQLSLKNLYRLLTVKDYPVYSTGILIGKHKKGLTLGRFWNEYLLYEWRNTEHGRMIWRTSGSKNRYHSEFCNRRENFPLYTIYMQEIMNGMGPESFGNQIDLFEKFLNEKEYDHTVFMMKIRTFLHMAGKTDPWMSKECADKFLSWMDGAEVNRKKISESFIAAWFLTMLSLHAMSGKEMSGKIMENLRNRSDLELEAIWNRVHSAKRDNSPLYLTLRNSELCTAPLPSEHFFGREEEMYDLKELLLRGGKYLVCGLGGIGKTELLRQLIRWCEREGAAEQIAVVQYEESLVSSFSRSFLNLESQDEQQRFHESIYKLNKAGQKEKVVLFLDNMNRAEEADREIAELKELPCTIFVTSRQEPLEGFSSFAVGAPEKSALSLIFRDNYGRVLPKEEREDLGRFLEKEIFRHPLTLRLLGKAAGSQMWTLKKLKTEIENNWSETAGETGLLNMYRRLYQVSDFGISGSRLIRMFAILPYRTVDANFTNMFFQGFVRENDELKTELQRLCQLGWLEDLQEGYRMHPVIAESILIQAPQEDEFAPFWERAQKCFFIGQAGPQDDSRMEEIAEIIWSAVTRIKGQISEKLLMLAICAVKYQGVTYRASTVIEDMLKRCPKVSEETWFMAKNISVMFDSIAESYDEIFYQQFEKKSLPKEWLRDAFFAYMERLLEGGKLKDTQEMISRILKKTDDVDIKISAALGRAHLCELTTEFAEGIFWIENGLWMAKQSGHTDRVGEMLYRKAALHRGLGERDAIVRCLEACEQILGTQLGKTSFDIYIYQMHTWVAWLDQDQEKALEYMEKCKDTTLVYWGMKHQGYLATCEELGVAYNRVGRRAESLENHFLVRNTLQKDASNESSMLCIVNNNIGVTYLDGKDPENAVIYLKEAYQLAKENNLGEIATAEPAWNLSRAFRMMGNEEEEKKYLQIALERFERNYPLEHPKRVAAKERMEEIHF